MFRRIDFYTQAILGGLMILSMPFFLLFGFLAGLFVLGVLQLISAALNTKAFIAAGYRKQIRNYWLYTGITLFIICVSLLLNNWFDPDDMQVPFWIAVTASVPIAFYYLTIYHKLISHFQRMRELGGLIKSKH
ncbi:MAG: hypothetical protein H7Y42_12790 [Chitinophagaceae bacterium]|nr:hypothetical protein [Chitinophagaceae bacterium]